MSLASNYNLLDKYGFDTTITRPVFGGAPITATTRVMRRRLEEQSLIHDVSQDMTRFLVRRQELEDQSYPLPIRKGDTILEDGIYYTVHSAEPQRDGPNIIGYECRTIGD